MPTVKEYNIKIGSFKNTRKITKTMKMVSARKMRKAQQMQKHADMVIADMNTIFSKLAFSRYSGSSPVLEIRPEIKNVLVLVFTSDRGLCGGFNNNLAKTVGRWIEDNRAGHKKIQLGFCGKRGQLFFKNRYDIRLYFEGVMVYPSYNNARRISYTLQEAFLSGEYDEIYLAYNVFKGVLSQIPALEKILPVRLPESMAVDEDRDSTDCILEPRLNDLVDFILPKLATIRIYSALLNNAAGEHAARMNAMENSTKNTDRLIDEYTLLRNRARQASITRELIEVISGAEALK